MNTAEKALRELVEYAEELRREMWEDELEPDGVAWGLLHAKVMAAGRELGAKEITQNYWNYMHQQTVARAGELFEEMAGGE